MSYDEPLYLDKVYIEDESILAEKKIPQKIQSLLLKQNFAVLSTISNKTSNSSLISYAVSKDFKNIVFATPFKTRKFDYIIQTQNVSLLIDNRNEHYKNLNSIEAVTVIGKATKIESEEDITSCRNIISEKHPYLKKFVCAPTSALILVRVSSYNYVTNFQECFRWTP